MRRVANFLWLTSGDKLFLVRCFLTLAAVRAGLSLLPFKTLRQWMQNGAATGSASIEEERRLAWGVHHASALVPAATCLTQALTGQFLLGRLGYRAQIRIGVRQAESGRLLAHAWLISGGRIVLGGADAEIQRFTPLTDFDTGST